MSQQSGFSLVGVMVGMLVSVLLFFAGGTIYQQTQLKEKYIKSHAIEEQDKKRILLDFVKNKVALAGYAQPVSSTGTVVDLSTINFGGNIIEGTTGNAVASGVTSDALIYRFQAPNTGMDIRDCADILVPASSNSVNTVTVQASSGEYEYGLFCNDVEIVNGINGFVVLYGEDLTADGSANRYVAADYVGLNFDRVVSLRFTFDILINEGAGVIEEQEFSTTVALRNARTE